MPALALRPLAVVMLAMLMASPLVRTLCAWECDTTAPTWAAPASAEHGHCASTVEGVPADSPALLASGDCERCDILEEAQAAVRPALTGVAPALPASAWHGGAEGFLSPDLRAGAPERAPSPPLRAPYPLRI